jgi:hypothetical protein
MLISSGNGISAEMRELFHVIPMLVILSVEKASCVLPEWLDYYHGRHVYRNRNFFLFQQFSMRG